MLVAQILILLLALSAGCGDAQPMESGTPGVSTSGVGEGLTTYFGDVIITSSTDVERLVGYSVVKGNIFINPLGLSDLRGLEQLQRVEGTLDIAYDQTQRQSLKSLDGLRSLQVVTGYVQVENCDLLEHLGGLDSLRTVGGSLSVYNNERLNSVDALQGIEQIELNFNILNNPQLPCHEAESLVMGLGESAVGGEVSVLNNGEQVGATCP